ncbi:glycoside hydrolase family 3 protein [Dinghuibacter silviterrae]|uniref:Beta-glucosidase n=1 Tax=Dinghuibacter silviterrae TaxID=1539049 RepID=A0A4R8DKQ0_9BACT|nr:glycoside hydrolase family 3 protein [Dinghuibacter silviterrae]TDW97580.1 beta-glucosidase [Dinghuibacter silviterrae]
MNTRLFLLVPTLALAGLCAKAQTPVYQDPHQPADARAADLIQRLSLKEKISLLGFVSPGVPHLGIQRYVWWNEGLHGVARAGEATVFPQAIGVAATFDDALLRVEGDAVSTEARAKYNMSVAEGRRQQYLGLTFWAPNINIFRDPRWGRGQETYGEDPYLTGRMGSAYVRGMQGNDPLHLKTAACAKHFAVHSGPEASRHSINVRVNEDELRETYLPAFHTLVDSGVEAVMCAYNRVNDQPCCTGRTLLKDILRDEWHFKGHVVSDCGALDDIWERHKALPDAATVAAEAIKTGVNVDCSNLLQADAETAVQKGLINEEDVNKDLAPNLRTAFHLGLYDDPSLSPYKDYGADSVANAYHQQLALQMAEESMVLLRNDGALPLKAANVKTMLIAGSNATSADALLGNYHGTSSHMVTFVEGITAIAGPATGVEYDLGCDPKDTVHFGGTWVASFSDVVVAVIGLTPQVEGEEGDAFLSDAGGDKKTLSLPAGQLAYIRALRKATHKPIIAVVTGGSAMDVDALAPFVNAIIVAWYPGQEGGAALANILFGRVAPSGHLPVTFYKSVADLPAYDDYHVKGRTYRYYEGEVEYPFGFGLSYTTFSYSWAGKPQKIGDTLRFAVQVTAKSDSIPAVAVPQVYIEYPSVPGKLMPVRELKQFARVTPGAIQPFAIPLSALRKWDAEHHDWKLYPGTYRLVIGENSRDEQLSYKFIVK